MRTEIHNVKVILQLPVFSLARLFWSGLHAFDQSERSKKKTEEPNCQWFFSNMTFWLRFYTWSVFLHLKAFLSGKRWFTQIWLFPDRDQFWRYFYWEKTLPPYGLTSSPVATLKVTLDTDLDVGKQLHLFSLSWLKNSNFCPKCNQTRDFVLFFKSNLVTI